MRRRLDNGRREELLDGVMRIIAARGFSDVRIPEVARELHCSVATLYKIAPSKDSLLVLALGRWGELVLERSEARLRRARTASKRARLYYLATVESLHPLSLSFRRDVERFPSTHVAYQLISDRFVDRFVELLDDAVEAGEIRPTNTRFLALVFRYISQAIRDEQALRASGLTTEEAALLVDGLIWDGIRNRDSIGAEEGRDAMRPRRPRVSRQADS